MAGLRAKREQIYPSSGWQAMGAARAAKKGGSLKRKVKTDNKREQKVITENIKNEAEQHHQKPPRQDTKKF